MQKRLQKLCELVEGNSVADIGCDHGFLCEMLVEKGIKNIYACEVTEKNLSKAKSNIVNYVNRTQKNVKQSADFINYDGGSVAFVLSDGFKNLQNNIDCAIIAGIGGDLILNILFNDVTKMPNTLVLQPMTKPEKVRTELSKHYEFIEDKVLFDCGHYYNIMKLKKGKDNLSDLEISFGKTNLQTLHPEFKDYLSKLKLRVGEIHSQEYENLKRQIEKVEEMYE